MTLTDKVALVTGGARGIGRAICEALLDEKVKVCVTDILESDGEATLEELSEKYGVENVIFHKLNVVDENEFEDVVVKTIKHFEHLDILCNNAGYCNEENPRRTIDVNLIGVVNGIRVAHKHLVNSKGKKGGTVVNTASCVGIQPTYSLPVYSATKSAVVALTATWGHEKNVELTKVKVNCVCPDATDTPMLAELRALPCHIKEVKRVIGSKKDLILKPSDIANGVVKILHDDVSRAVYYVNMIKGPHYYSLKEGDYFDTIAQLNFISISQHKIN